MKLFIGFSVNGSLTDFTICLRLKINVFDITFNEAKIFKLIDGFTKDQFILKLSNRQVHYLKFIDKDSNESKAIFRSEILHLQWNSICIIRNLKEEKLQIFQNGMSGIQLNNHF